NQARFQGHAIGCLVRRISAENPLLMTAGLFAVRSFNLRHAASVLDPLYVAFTSAVSAERTFSEPDTCRRIWPGGVTKNIRESAHEKHPFADRRSDGCDRAQSCNAGLRSELTGRAVGYVGHRSCETAARAQGSETAAGARQCSRLLWPGTVGIVQLHDAAIRAVLHPHRRH